MACSKISNLAMALGNEMVTIIVGEEKRKFVLHKQLLCDSVQFFRTAFSAGRFQESQTSIMEMPEDEPEGFEVFVSWLYRARLPAPSKPEDFDRLLSVYIFAEKFCIDELANMTIDTIQAMKGGLEVCSLLNPDNTEMIWRNTSLASPLRKFLVHALAFKLCNFEQIHAGLCKQRFKDNYNLIAEWKYFKDNCELFASFDNQLQKHSANELPSDPSDSSRWTKCYFHRHFTGEICHST